MAGLNGVLCSGIIGVHCCGMVAYFCRNIYPERDWLQIAVDCGYYDYQHLAKDYKDFTGLTPVELHILESKSPENVLGLASEIYRSRISML